MCQPAHGPRNLGKHAMHGDPKARVFQVDNSLTANIFLPESFDLIVTNPPFKKGGIKAGSEHGDAILGQFRSDILPDGRCGMAGKRGSQPCHGQP